jgi:hypothetical protein
MDGEARAARIAADLLDARLIAASVAEREGRLRRSGRIFREPDRIIVREGARPVFVYARPWVAYSLTRSDGHLIETRYAGSVTQHRLYRPSGVLISEERALRGDGSRN